VRYLIETNRDLPLPDVLLLLLPMLAMDPMTSQCN